MMAALPFFHVFGLSVAMNFSIHMGWGDLLVPKPQPEPLLETISKFKPTFAPLVPTMYIGILNHPDIQNTDLTDDYIKAVEYFGFNLEDLIQLNLNAIVASFLPKDKQERLRKDYLEKVEQFKERYSLGGAG